MAKRTAGTTLPSRKLVHHWSGRCQWVADHGLNFDFVRWSAGEPVKWTYANVLSWLQVNCPVTALSDSI